MVRSWHRTDHCVSLPSGSLRKCAVPGIYSLLNLYSLYEQPRQRKIRTAIIEILHLRPDLAWRKIVSVLSAFLSLF